MNAKFWQISLVALLLQTGQNKKSAVCHFFLFIDENSTRDDSPATRMSM